MAQQQRDCEVLIAGAGPTGITLALMLARRGVSTIVIDKEADIYPLPRAAHIDHEIMRILEELGVAGEVAAVSRAASRYDFLTADGRILLRFDGTDRIGPGGWPASNMIHQPSVEATLRRAAAAENRLALRTSWSWTSYEEDEGGVVSTLAAPDGARKIRSRFLVGADGARSPVRAAAGIEMDDLAFDEHWLVIDVLVHDAERLPKVNLQICDPARPTTCVLMGSGRHRWEFMLRADETAEAALDERFIAALLAPWKVEGAVTLERKAVYRFNAKLARQWRKGRVLLAGDAAHLTPPFAGQGLCAGLRDAANLAWKLSAVAKGADPAVLDSYQSERAPHARALIDLAMMMGRTVCIADPEAARARDEQMLAARAEGKAPGGALPMPALGPGVLCRGSTAAGAYFPQFIGAEGARLDAALGAGPWLIARAGAAARDGLTAAGLDDARLAPFRDQIADWLARHEAPAVLVRPDRYIFGTGAADDLVRAWMRH